MTDDALSTLGLPPIDQIGFVVKDLGETKKTECEAILQGLNAATAAQ